MTAPTLVSLFSGGGGSSCGYKQAGYEIRLAVEWHIPAAACYRVNFPGTALFDGDIRALEAAEALRLARVRRGELDVLDGSPPCQGFSSSGSRRFGDPRNSLFEEYCRLLAEMRPRAFVAENVPGMARGKMRLIFAKITAALRECGYRVSCRELRAWWYGVPQDRRRLFWVGIREDIGVKPSHPPPERARPVTVGEACPWIYRMEHVGYSRSRLRMVDVRNDSAPTLTVGVRGINSYHTRVGVISDPHSPEELRPTVVPKEYAVSAEYARVRASMKSKFFNLRLARPDRPCPTLEACWGRSLSMAAVMHPTERRRLTIREAKILSGFPEEFDPSFLSYADAWAVIGNAVPPPMARAVGAHVASLLP